MITFKVDGDWKKTERYLDALTNKSFDNILRKYGERGVNALRDATPVRTGATANSWSYEITKTGSGYTLTWLNSNVNRNVNIALLIQYGHGTGTGGYVSGYDYINPSIRPIFDKIAEEIFLEVEIK